MKTYSLEKARGNLLAAEYAVCEARAMLSTALRTHTTSLDTFAYVNANPTTNAVKLAAYAFWEASFAEETAAVKKMREAEHLLADARADFFLLGGKL